MARAKNGKAGAADERKASGRFFDQPGQWIDKTPANVKKKRAKGVAAIAKSMKGKK